MEDKVLSLRAKLFVAESKLARLSEKCKNADKERSKLSKDYEATVRLCNNLKGSLKAATREAAESSLSEATQMPEFLLKKKGKARMWRLGACVGDQPEALKQDVELMIGSSAVRVTSAPIQENIHSQDNLRREEVVEILVKISRTAKYLVEAGFGPEDNKYFVALAMRGMASMTNVNGKLVEEGQPYVSHHRENHFREHASSALIPFLNREGAALLLKHHWNDFVELFRENQ